MSSELEGYIDDAVPVELGQPMADLLAGFIVELRSAGIPVSLTENLDAMRAVEQIPLLDREAFKYALAATMVKNHAHWRAFETVFEVYFSLRGKQYALDADADIPDAYYAMASVRQAQGDLFGCFRAALEAQRRGPRFYEAHYLIGGILFEVGRIAEGLGRLELAARLGPKAVIVQMPLANACAQTRYGGAVAACGLAQGMDFPASVAPFILRGVSLLGIDSVMAPKELRLAAWKRLSRDLDPLALDVIAEEIALGDVIDAAAELMDGKVRGRIVVDVNR